MTANPILTDLQANGKSIDWNLGRITGVPKGNVHFLNKKSKKSDFFAWGSQFIPAIHKGRFPVGYPAKGNIPPSEWLSTLIPVAPICSEVSVHSELRSLLSSRTTPPSSNCDRSSAQNRYGRCFGKGSKAVAKTFGTRVTFAWRAFVFPS